MFLKNSKESLLILVSGFGQKHWVIKDLQNPKQFVLTSLNKDIYLVLLEKLFLIINEDRRLRDLSCTNNTFCVCSNTSADKKCILSFCWFCKTNNGFWLTEYYFLFKISVWAEDQKKSLISYIALLLSNSQNKAEQNKVYVLVETLATLKSMAEFPLISLESGFYLHL